MNGNTRPNEWDLNLNGDTFNAMKSDFNAILRKTLSNMETKESELAEITVKMKISLKKEQQPLAGAVRREVVIPKFEHKVRSVMQIKSETDGSLGGNYELVWDKDRSEYIMREITDPQMNMFDSQSEQPNAVNVHTDSKEIPELRGGEILSLPDNSSEVEKARESCDKNFPSCCCVRCSNFSEGCCSEHSRDCEDMGVCPDFIPIVPFAEEPENLNKEEHDAYDYDEPEEE